MFELSSGNRTCDPKATEINPTDLTVSKRPGTSYQIEIHFAVFNHLYLSFSIIKLVET